MAAILRPSDLFCCAISLDTIRKAMSWQDMTGHPSQQDTLTQCCLTLGKRRRRCASNETELFQRVVFADMPWQLAIRENTTHSPNGWFDAGPAS